MTDRFHRWRHGRSIGDRRARPSLDQLPQLAWQTVTPLPPPSPGWHHLASAILLDGTLGLLRADIDVAATWSAFVEAGGQRDAFVLPAGARCCLTAFDGVSETAGHVVPLHHLFPASTGLPMAAGSSRTISAASTRRRSGR